MASRVRLSAEKKAALRLTAAQLYCTGKSPTEIIHQLSAIHKVETNDMYVSRLLKEAKACGIIKLVYSPPLLDDLQRKLVAKYRCLKEAVIIPVGAESEFETQTLAQVAADYFDRLILERPDIKIGISGGTTIYHMVQALARKERKMAIYPTALIGRGPRLPEHIDPMVLLSILREKSGPSTHAFYVTMLPFEKGTRPQAVRKDNNRLKTTHQKVKEVWDGMQKVEAVFASIGTAGGWAADQSPGRTFMRLLEEFGVTQKQLEAQGAVGDLSYSLFDDKGATKASWEFFITLGVDFFREMAAEYPRRRVVLIAGRHKEKPLKAALAGKLCSTIITDSATADYLLQS
jgi:DNA-binding transcriptional regulator LsrR (DeoR family)